MGGHTNGANGHTVRLTIPAKAEYVSLCRLALAGLARVHSVGEETLADLKLAITEAASNSVRHAYADGSGVVEVVYRLDGVRLEVEVADAGTGFEVGTANGDPEDLAEGGLGIAIIRSIADEFELRSDQAGSRLRFAKII
ncbi:MAG TPA: ATP-binding protein [Candidatus Limnocylindrales bacterium]|nr:ATP-binding protein [Candidatus Limnocylindrales bacterium]